MTATHKRKETETIGGSERKGERKRAKTKQINQFSFDQLMFCFLFDTHCNRTKTLLRTHQIRIDRLDFPLTQQFVAELVPMEIYANVLVHAKIKML